MAHVTERHGLIKVMETAGVSALVTLLIGDVEGLFLWEHSYFRTRQSMLTLVKVKRKLMKSALKPCTRQISIRKE